MQLTSFSFYLFLAAVFGLYWALPAPKRWGAALGGSVLFYALFGVPTLCVLAGCIVGSYWLGLWLAGRKGSRTALAAALALALAPLVTFKYFNSLSAAFGSSKTLFTAIGISFFTFKIIAYLVDVWRGNLAAQRHFGKYALYVSFFPQVISGPIQRPGDLLAQIDAPHAFCSTQALQAVQLIGWGLFQKLVIADNLSYYVQNGFRTPQLVMGPSLILAAVLYSVQLYADFAGYSNIAIGCMGLLGFQTPPNFQSPYFAVSIRDFWARWHISLSSFLRDYVYFPLGGSRCSTLRRCCNLMITFLISGLWHGTGLQFIVWGALHGLYQVCGVLTTPLRKAAWAKAPLRENHWAVQACKMMFMFAIVTAAWVFFGADSLSHALEIFSRMPDSFGLSLSTWKNAAAMLGFNTMMLGRMALCCGVLAAVDFCSREAGFTAWFAKRPAFVQTACCYLLALAVLFWAPASGGGFIYFQF